MRRGIFIVFLILTGCLLFGQSKSIRAGDFMIGGNINGGIETGADSTLDKDGKEISGNTFNQFRVGISMETGYFLVNNLEIGPIFDIEMTSKIYAGNSNNHTDTRTIGLGLQLGYFLDMPGMLAGYMKVTGLYNMYTIQTFLNGNPNPETSLSGFLIVPEAGLAVFLNESAAVLIGGFFSYDIMKNKATENSDLQVRYGLKLSASMFL